MLPIHEIPPSKGTKGYATRNDIINNFIADDGF